VKHGEGAVLFCVLGLATARLAMAQKMHRTLLQNSLYG